VYRCLGGTVRLVLWTNEEHGVRGGQAYAAAHASEAARHVFALESDSGVFAPLVVGFSGTPAARQTIRDVLSLLAPVVPAELVAGGGGADIGPIAQLGSVPTGALIGDPTKFFPIHHSSADTVERIPPQDLARAAAAMAGLAYVVAEMPAPLVRER
jgi:carboxypeptidase Q